MTKEKKSKRNPPLVRVKELSTRWRPAPQSLCLFFLEFARLKEGYFDFRLRTSFRFLRACLSLYAIYSNSGVSGLTHWHMYMYMYMHIHHTEQ